MEDSVIVLDGLGEAGMLEESGREQLDEQLAVQAGGEA